MPILPLSYYPDNVLQAAAEPVTEFDERLQRLVKDMFLTMYAAPGVGLAAPQVGIAKRLFVMDCFREGESKCVVVANPEIIHVEGEQNDDEGCLSIPGYSYKVRRPMRVVVRGQDVYGNEFEYAGSEYEARCIVHETDHCDGILYIRRLSPVKRQEIVSSIKKKIKAGRWPDQEPERGAKRWFDRMKSDLGATEPT